MSENGSRPTYVVDDKQRGVFRVHRSSMTDELVLERERRRVFERSWLYIGHDSEIPGEGDYRRRRVAGRSMIFVRGRDGVVRVLHNTCTHRGAIVCRQDAGTAKAFQCFYHAWTYTTEGELVGIPGRDAYAEECFVKGERSLRPVARLEEYRGFWFVSLQQDIMSLYDYLAGAREYLDLLIDQSPSAQMKVAEGSHRYSMRANWKLLCENSVDGYHGMPTHQTYFDYVIATGGLGGGGKALKGRGYSLGNGHAVIEYWSPWGRPVARWAPQMGEEAKPEIERTKAEMVQRHGRDRAERICEWNRNMIIYPNLVINDIMAATIRTFWPVRTDLMEIDAWAIAPAEEQGERLHTRLRNFLEFLGPGGFATPDDVEALESCQIGFGSGGEEYNDMSRGMHRPAQFDDELQMRTWWRQWAAQMSDVEIERWDDEIPADAAEAAPPPGWMAPAVA
ncbi:MAG TPA: aromatic ring-hydroxylating dioxygenase subunit alpha [Solirubrobacteraceae bacterium]|jgi:p-cumate 2,3-dioxygenase alpha subunit|nr:aromatic ring-hydroxylating dioxygenase subunit alpha [Solirubrobacteraceae bacterium]